MGLYEQARAVIEARKALTKALHDPCVCDSMTLNRDGCQCGGEKAIKQARAILKAKVDALCEEPFEEDVDPAEDRIVADPSVMLKVAGRPFRCNCGANVFRRFTNGQYQCNSCDTLYEGE